jgi:hypothetical protein
MEARGNRAELYTMWFIGVFEQDFLREEGKFGKSGWLFTGQPLDSLQVDPGGSFLDLFEAEKSACAGSGAGVADFLPRFGAGKVGIPERPCSALDGACLVDGAFASPWVEECAVSVGKFGEGDFSADDAGVEQADFADGFAEVVGDFLEFFVGDPDGARGAGAAVAALGAGEIEAFKVPGLWVGRGGFGVCSEAICRRCGQRFWMGIGLGHGGSAI